MLHLNNLHFGIKHAYHLQKCLCLVRGVLHIFLDWAYFDDECKYVYVVVDMS